MNLIDVTRQFPTDEECLKYIEQMRWPDGIVRCPTCGCDRISRDYPHQRYQEGREGSKNQRGAGACTSVEPTCLQQFSVTSGTIFQVPVCPCRNSFGAISLLSWMRRRGSARSNFSRSLGLRIATSTAWHLTHRIRKAMEEATGGIGNMLRGIVELDETYGGRQRQSVRDGRKENQNRVEKFDMVLGMRERDGNGRQARTREVRSHPGRQKEATIREAVRKYVVPIRPASTRTMLPFIPGHSTRVTKKHRTCEPLDSMDSTGNHIHTNTVESHFHYLNAA